MNSLQLPLRKKWFDLTQDGVKKEDYREITAYWCKRILTVNNFVFDWDQFFNDVEDPINLIIVGITKKYFHFKKFEVNAMTLGYPRSIDSDRILRLEHKGIEIGSGLQAWGGELDKLYFVIKHGAILPHINTKK